MENIIDKHIQLLIKSGEEVQAGDWQGRSEYAEQIMLVLYNADIKIDCPESIAHMRLKTKADYKWADEHFEERIGREPTNPGESYKRWPYASFTEENDPYKDGKLFSHTYQERFWPTHAGDEYNNARGIRYPFGEFDNVIEQLSKNPLTRQAYLPIFFPEDTGAVHGQRVPCTLGYQFFLKRGELHMNYYIRSCDALRHFRNDIYLAMRLMYHVGTKVSHIKRLGYMNMYITNFHVFKNDLYALNKKEQKLKRNG